MMWDLSGGNNGMNPNPNAPHTPYAQFPVPQHPNNNIGGYSSSYPPPAVGMPYSPSFPSSHPGFISRPEPPVGMPVPVSRGENPPRPHRRLRKPSRPDVPTQGHGHSHSQGHVPAQPQQSSSHYQPQAPLHPGFKYSKCNGRKKALCIGINYTGHRGELRGCVNDARNVQKFLTKHHGYKERDIILLTDNTTDPRKLPTKKNILEAMRWLVKSACPNDSLFFHYSGHGGQVRDTDGDEVDGWDEIIFPLDHETRGYIIDDEMHEIMVKPLPSGCRLTALFDSCHSGTVLDLPYIYSSHGRLKGSHVSNRARKLKATPADVISWSGCKDGQTSADTFAGGVAVGAMSHAFISSLDRKPKQTYIELLKSVREILYPKYSQKPQLGSSHPIDTSLQFII